jgi:hypothetical protein
MMEIERELKLKHRIATVGLGAIVVWWGIALALDDITIGLAVAGTGVLLLGMNAFRSWKGITINKSSTMLGSVGTVWGSLDFGLSLRFLPSISLLLIIIGLLWIASSAIRTKFE